MKRFLMISAGVMALAAVPAQAATIVYGDAGSFNAALGTTVVDDYENPGYNFIQDNATMSGVLGETRYEPTGFSNNNLIPTANGNQYYCAGCNGSFNLFFDATSVTTGNGVFGVGLNYFNTNPNVNFDALVTYGNGDTELFDLAIVSVSDFDGFFGLTSDRLISSISFGPDGGITQNGSFGIDNLTIGDMGRMGAVPEPATWAFMILGFGAIGSAMRRQKKTAHKASVKVSYA
ncbi:MAG: PEPxxWA-CTERM sorting domain-containing protein [Pseudomonadota bacterium]